MKFNQGCDCAKITACPLVSALDVYQFRLSVTCGMFNVAGK